MTETNKQISMRKKMIWGFVLLLLGALIWYLFLKPNDYQITFKTKAIPGTINQAIKLWADGLENSKLVNQTNLQHFSHQLQFSDSIYTYEWHIKPLNDSTSRVKVLVTDLENSLPNKIAGQTLLKIIMIRTKRLSLHSLW